MAYIYRYIDLKKEEVCYVGKITKFKDNWNNPLANRHKQHKGEEWYKDIGDENLLLQYIELDSHTDADILETWLINYYCPTGQLVNKAKMDWGKSNIDLYPVFYGRWRNYGQNKEMNKEKIYAALGPVIDDLLRESNGLEYDLDFALDYFNERVREMATDLRKSYRISRYDAQDDFLRVKKPEPKV